MQAIAHQLIKTSSSFDGHVELMRTRIVLLNFEHYVMAWMWMQAHKQGLVYRKNKKGVGT